VRNALQLANTEADVLIANNMYASAIEFLEGARRKGDLFLDELWESRITQSPEVPAELVGIYQRLVTIFQNQGDSQAALETLAQARNINERLFRRRR
jgi:hypothetical protein